MKTKKVCAEPGCSKACAKDSTRCPKHRTAKQRAANPMKAAYQALKDNAKRRGKIFLLTFEQFSEFAVKTDYITGRGKSKDSFSIDRIDNDRGYEVGNIKVITLSDNTKKQRKLEYDWRTGTAMVIDAKPENNTVEDSPF